jgi:hypothetical protein
MVSIWTHSDTGSIWTESDMVSIWTESDMVSIWTQHKKYVTNRQTSLLLLHLIM